MEKSYILLTNCSITRTLENSYLLRVWQSNSEACCLCPIVSRPIKPEVLSPILDVIQAALPCNPITSAGMVMFISLSQANPAPFIGMSLGFSGYHKAVSTIPTTHKHLKLQLFLTCPSLPHEVRSSLKRSCITERLHFAYG